MYKKIPIALHNACKILTPHDLKDAERFWFLEVQKSMQKQLIKGDYKRLCPKINTEGIIVVGGRAEKWFQHRYDHDTLVLLPYHHKFTKLYAEQIHRDGGHLADAATISKIRSKVWIPKISQNGLFLRILSIFR